MEYISSSELMNVIWLCLGRSWWMSPLEKRLLKNRTAFTINNAPIPIAKRFHVLLDWSPFHHTNIPVVSLYVPYYSCIQEFKFIMYVKFHCIQTYSLISMLFLTFRFPYLRSPSLPTLIQTYLTWTWAWVPSPVHHILVLRLRTWQIQHRFLRFFDFWFRLRRFSEISKLWQLKKKCQMFPSASLKLHRLQPERWSEGCQGKCSFNTADPKTSKGRWANVVFVFAVDVDDDDDDVVDLRFVALMLLQVPIVCPKAFSSPFQPTRDIANVGEAPPPAHLLRRNVAVTWLVLWRICDLWFVPVVPPASLCSLLNHSYGVSRWLWSRVSEKLCLQNV